MQPQPGSAERIVTGEAVAVDLRPAGIGSRGVALVVDMAVQFVITLLWVWAATNTGSSLDSAAASAVLLFLFVLTLLGYPVLFETFWRGRTPGKAAMGLRVVRDDGGPIRFRHAFVRGLVGVVVDRPGISLGLLALLPMLFTARSKRMGDLTAGTVVVQERVPSRVPLTHVVPLPLQPWAAGLDLTGLTDHLAMEIRQFLGRAHQLAPWAREEMGGRLLDEVTRRVGPLPPGLDPWTYLSTLLAERSRREALRLGAAASAPGSAPGQPPVQPWGQVPASQAEAPGPSPASERWLPAPPPPSPPGTGPFAPPG